MKTMWILKCVGGGSLGARSRGRGGMGPKVGGERGEGGEGGWREPSQYSKREKGEGKVRRIVGVVLCAVWSKAFRHRDGTQEPTSVN